MDNPFNPGSGVTPPFLAGRQSQIKKFEDLLESVKDGHIENALVYGLRGTGKTVLLERFREICFKKGFLPIMRSQFSEKYCDAAYFEQALKFDISSSIESFSRLAILKDNVKAVLEFIRPKKVGVEGLFYYEPAYESKRGAPFEDFLEDYLCKNWAVFERAGYCGVVFLYDEFHTVVDKSGQFVLSDFIAALNEAQKSKAKYMAVFCGLPNLRLNVKEARSYTERMFCDVLVDNLNEQQSKLAIECPLKDGKYSFNENLVCTLITDTGGYPYFIQFYCKEIVANARRDVITQEDYELIKPSIIKQLDISFFDPRFELASMDEQEVLLRMSKYKSKDIPFDYIRGNANKTSVIRSLNRLEKKGITYNFKRGFYRFSIPMFKEYLRRKP